MSRVAILRASGTNCDQETARAFQIAGAKHIDILHLNRLLEKPEILGNFGILCLPGGFSFGDDLGAGRIFAVKIRHVLSDILQQFRDADKLILGICNGFQVLLKAGLLGDPARMTLTWNTPPRYTDRWVRLHTNPSKCVFLQGIDSLYLPIAHAEGRFAVSSPDDLAALQQNQQLPLCYEAGDNPNGSEENVAGVCDATGHVFGLMPHPERYIDAVQHPHWTRFRRVPAEGSGTALFHNAVKYTA
ncbi:MAG: phosphoribosylformylglycinamidine synthase subunit PurQ [Planctomycetaceae bacterium]|jgi:phosphoribosylformylglycinamidine synthase|nr:phosphoribosylformylglycinamidine synthase subunit PurQ [Planctomycetaceae bacterium]